ncbi:MAG: type II toxin-antitoxin system PemK/MazF family toxin [Deltaproteobacteria bacterium]|jgi:mRNA interferase MazF|nr:type II toxin-antitoxin system PemK/MazF family toxin [Deltaproteobacteria bacterium]
MNYIPHKGDFVVLTFDPQSGHEQKGRRPAIIISNTLFNQHTGLAIVCPITNTNRIFPFHVEVPKASSLSGFIMVEQIKSVDFKQRQIKFIEKAPFETIDEVLGILDACIYQET